MKYQSKDRNYFTKATKKPQKNAKRLIKGTEMKLINGLGFRLFIIIIIILFHFDIARYKPNT